MIDKTIMSIMFFVPRVFVFYSHTIGLFRDILLELKYDILRYKLYCPFRTRTLMLQLLQHVRVLQDVTAVMTLQQQGLFTLYVKLGNYRLITVAYARRVHALNYALDDFWQLYLQLFHHVIITNDVYSSVRRNQRNPVNFLRIKRAPLNFHDVLRLETFARNVDGDGHDSLFVPCYPQDFNHV